ncbi:hypothetical protein NDN08_005432 [Rhodosorus marinus]|uniref:Uncharacterized protein n=1 Tax=Rhodosorus marinus TaxID=101924 RepID=A0AAV8V4S0_9RHOD|nr:hypothetical protein NDN08_005432 [Rhodosorus marinus]
MGARRVPWSDWEEWWEVIDGLLKWEESPDGARRALERVCAWRARSVLSVAVDGVASLVEVLLQPSCETTRLAMGLVLTRVVNALTEKEQSGRVAAPLSVLGAALGLPEGLVELRHDATHNALPTLAAMRTSSKQCLSFFYETYILPQYELSMNRGAGIISNAENESGDFGSALHLETARLSQAHQAGDQRAARDAFDVLISMLERALPAGSTRPDQALWTTIRALMPLAHKEDAREVINRCASVLNLPAAQKARFESLIEISEPEFFHANSSDWEKVLGALMEQDPLVETTEKISSLLESRHRSTWKGRSPWSLCPAKEWEGIPLGLLPGSSKVPKLVREGSHSPDENNSALIDDPVGVPSITLQQIDTMSRHLVELLES